MWSRRAFLSGLAASAYAAADHAFGASQAETKETRRAVEAVMTDYGNPNDVRAYLKNNPVGFDRLWLRRPSGEEIIALYRDYRLGLAIVPSQCLNLSYFWRDVNDRNVGVTVAVGLFDVLSRMQVSLSTMAGTPVPFILNSGYRTPEHNAKLEGAAVASEHLNARASDLGVPGFAPPIVANSGSMLGAGGIGVYPSFTHVDVGAPGRRWRG
nr:DUF882 domain-containing protein [Allorhizobium sp. Av2]